jgi:hypothetical protein
LTAKRRAKIKLLAFDDACYDCVKSYTETNCIRAIAAVVSNTFWTVI